MTNLPEKKPEEKPETKFWYGVTNRHWISIKFQYFFCLGGASSSELFMVLFFRSIGLTTPQIGLLEFLNILVFLVVRPLCGSIADKTSRHSIVLGTCLALFILPLLSFMFFTDKRPEHVIATLFPNSDGLVVEVCNEDVADMLRNGSAVLSVSDAAQNISGKVSDCHLKCFVPFSHPSVIANVTNVTKSSNCSALQTTSSANLPLFSNHSRPIDCLGQCDGIVLDNTITFIWICIIRLTGAAFYGPVLSLSDGIAYDMLGPTHRNLWGQQRMFGTIGFGIFSASVGALIDLLKTFKICFGTAAALFGGGSLVAFFWLPRRLNKKSSRQSEEKQVPFCKALRRVLSKPVFSINCLIAITTGMMMGVHLVVFPQWIDLLGAPKMFFGLTAALMCVFEMPTMFISGAVTDRIGESMCFLLTYVAYTIRSGVTAFLTPDTFWIAMPSEMLHVFCYGLYYPAASRLAATCAEPGTSSTVQAILATCFNGIGFCLGIMASSFCYSIFGGHIAFLIFASFALTCGLVFLLVYFTFLRNALKRLAQSHSQEEQREREEHLALGDRLMLEEQFECL